MEYRYIHQLLFPPLADPDVVMTPPSVEPTVVVPAGPFGARTPTSSLYDEAGLQRR